MKTFINFNGGLALTCFRTTESLARTNSEKCYVFFNGLLVFFCYAADNKKSFCFYHFDHSIVHRSSLSTSFANYSPSKNSTIFLTSCLGKPFCDSAKYMELNKCCCYRLSDPIALFLNIHDTRTLANKTNS